MSKRIAALERAHTAVNPAPVTIKFNVLKGAYLTVPILDAYARELKALKLGRLNVQAIKKNSREGAKFKLSLEGQQVPAQLADILSEGERRVLSLAAFLAEQDVGEGSGCLVFDDPMSSLDHRWTSSVAKRLVEEAQKRQIIVFTHDLVFFTELYKFAEDHNKNAGAHDDQKIKMKSERLVRQALSLGKVDPMGPPLRALHVADRIKRLMPMIEAACNETDSDERYEFEAKNCYSRMRDTWERVVEEKLFHRVVQRFQKDVKTQELRYLTSDPQILNDIHDGMVKANTFSHDNPVANSDPIPDADELLKDFVLLEDVIGRLVAHHKTV